MTSEAEASLKAMPTTSTGDPRDVLRNLCRKFAEGFEHRIAATANTGRDLPSSSSFFVDKKEADKLLINLVKSAGPRFEVNKRRQRNDGSNEETTARRRGPERNMSIVMTMNDVTTLEIQAGGLTARGPNEVPVKTLEDLRNLIRETTTTDSNWSSPENARNQLIRTSIEEWMRIFKEYFTYIKNLTVRILHELLPRFFGHFAYSRLQGVVE